MSTFVGDCMNAQKNDKMIVRYDRIRQLTNESGKKLSYLCEKCGKDRTYIAGCENKKQKMTIENLKIIAEELGTTVEYLKGETDEKKPTGIEAGELAELYGLNSDIRELVSLCLADAGLAAELLPLARRSRNAQAGQGSSV